MNLTERIRAARKGAEETFNLYRSGRGGFGAVFGLIRSIDSLSRTLHLARAKLGEGDPDLLALENYSASLFQDFVQRAKPPSTGSVWDWLRDYRTIVQRNGELVTLVVAIFFGTVLLGWMVARQLPEYTQALVSVPFLERIIQNKEWFSSLSENPLLGGVQLAVNNIKVTFLCFVAGVVFGLGGIFIMACNGLMLGAMLGFAASHGFDRTMVNFVSGHGPLELSVIVMGTFAGTLFGRAWVPPYRGKFSARLRSAASDAFIVVTGVAPWLVMAAIVEAFVSPLPNVPLHSKIALGCVLAGIFWLAAFMPVKPSPKSGARDRAS